MAFASALISQGAGPQDNIHVVYSGAKTRPDHSDRRGPQAEDIDNQAPPGRRIQLFSGLAMGDVSQIESAARILRRSRGEFIYLPGDRADSVYVLKKGRIKLSVLSESGKENAIDILHPGEIFGEFALIDESVRSNMTQTLDEVTMLVFSKGDFLSLLESRPNLAINYIRLVGDRRRRMEKKLSDITSKAVPARVCDLLYELSANGLRSDEESFIPLTQQDAASLIGASRQTTTSILNDLMRHGFIELGRGWVRIKSLKNIEAYLGSMLFAGAQAFFLLMSAS